MRNILAIDLGGTNSKYAVMNEAGAILEKGYESTAQSLEDLLLFIERKVADFADYSIAGIAISSPGAVAESGVIEGYSALPFIHGPNMKQLIEGRTNLAVTIENDANCAALAEIWQGTAKGKEDVAVVVLGTGVGGSIIKAGTVHKGANLHGGEFGYMILNTIGSDEVETFSDVASTLSIVRRVAKARNLDVASLTGETIFAEAEKGDEVAIEAITSFYRMLAIGCYNIQYAYDPEVILLGGGISSRPEMIDRLRKELEVVVASVDAAKLMPTVDVCHFLADANLVGAVYNFIQSMES